MLKTVNKEKLQIDWSLTFIFCSFFFFFPYSPPFPKAKLKIFSEEEKCLLYFILFKQEKTKKINLKKKKKNVGSYSVNILSHDQWT